MGCFVNTHSMDRIINAIFMGLAKVAKPHPPKSGTSGLTPPESCVKLINPTREATIHGTSFLRRVLSGVIFRSLLISGENS